MRKLWLLKDSLCKSRDRRFFDLFPNLTVRNYTFFLKNVKLENVLSTIAFRGRWMTLGGIGKTIFYIKLNILRFVFVEPSNLDIIEIAVLLGFKSFRRDMQQSI